MASRTIDDKAELPRWSSDIKSPSPSPSASQSQPSQPPRPSRRRSIITKVLLVCAAALYICQSNVSCDLTSALLGRIDNVYASVSKDPDAVARKILRKHPLIDGHNDLMMVIRALNKNQVHSSSFKKTFEHGQYPGHVDIPRIKTGQTGGAFWSAFMPCPANGSDFSDENYAPTVRATIQQLDLFDQLRTAYPKYFTPSSDAHDAAQAFYKHGKLISPIGIEGLHQIGNSPAALRLYHTLGVRYATLTWNCHNAYADAAITQDENGNSVSSKPLWHGLSTKGRDLVYEMNRLGMLVDLSHTSYDTMTDVLVGNDHSGGWRGSIAPPIFSHSSAYAICPHPRNVQDDVLHMVKQRNGLVMINFSPDFISCEESGSPSGLPTTITANATLLQVVRHIRHVGELIGYDHVGIGSDFDGIVSAPKGLEDVSKFPQLVAELLRQKIAEEDIIKITGGNLLRVWAEADAISLMMKMFWKPLDDDMPLRDEYIPWTASLEEA